MIEKRERRKPPVLTWEREGDDPAPNVWTNGRASF